MKNTLFIFAMLVIVTAMGQDSLVNNTKFVRNAKDTARIVDWKSSPNPTTLQFVEAGNVIFTIDSKDTIRYTDALGTQYKIIKVSYWSVWDSKAQKWNDLKRD